MQIQVRASALFFLVLSRLKLIWLSRSPTGIANWKCVEKSRGIAGFLCNKNASYVREKPTPYYSTVRRAQKMIGRHIMHVVCSFISRNTYLYSCTISIIRCSCWFSYEKAFFVVSAISRLSHMQLTYTVNGAFVRIVPQYSVYDELWILNYIIVFLFSIPFSLGLLYDTRA